MYLPKNHHSKIHDDKAIIHVENVYIGRMDFLFTITEFLRFQHFTNFLPTLIMENRRFKQG